MTLAIAGDWMLAVGAVLCAVLQWATFNMARKTKVEPVLTAGRGMLLAAWTVLAMRFMYLMTEVGDLPIPAITQLSLGLLEGGTIMVTLHWILGKEERECQSEA